MAIVFNGTTLNWYTQTIVKDGTTVSSPSDPGTVMFGTTKVFGLDGTYETSLYSNSLAPDSQNLENAISTLNGLVGTAFHSGSTTQGPGTDTTWTGYLAEGYRVVSSDGTFTGTASPGTSIAFYEGRTVTGINTSHNGGTTYEIFRDNGV